MKKHWMHHLVRAGVLLVLCATGLWAQGRRYDGPDDEAGDIAAERDGYMTGNRIMLYFRNTTELSNWTSSGVNASRWPNTYDGLRTVDGIGLLVGAKVFVDSNSVPVTDPAEIASRTDLFPLYFLQTSYREEMDRDPTGTIEWGFYPCWGYFNEDSEYPAMSNKPESWPPAGWPAQGQALHYAGEWDGRFGRGIIYAQQETYFVVNDAQDQEYLGPEDRRKYYPRPGVFIGDMMPDKVTIQNGNPWGGIGVRVEQRGFQWSNPQAQDAIFWEYTIANISDYDLPNVCFGYWVDNGIGSDAADDELGYFNKSLDMAYSWDINGIGLGSMPTGTMGFAYLESPGLAYDGIDNDQDGLTDEKRDNVATVIVGPTDGITDLQLFLDHYKLAMEDLKDHWDADEDQDWEDGEDLNGDGVYQTNEYAGDDVGLDGVGPSELNYTIPDQGECNHRPDYVEGEGCEPNFAETDVTESDMVGLTSFLLFPIQSHSSDYRWFRGDESMWDVVSADTLQEWSGKISNLVETFASGPFTLYKGRTERISMSELHSFDALTGLNSETHDAPALFELKKIVQIIYEKDYRFAMPPKMPTLTATAGDGQVILTWDNIADTRTRDPLLGNVNDFEGYKLYRATDKKMADALVITDGYGTATFLKPIFQCDLKDSIQGFTDFGLINGAGYNLGYDSGIMHHFIDNTVQNGRTYYYALVAYDYGAENIGPGISPTENEIIIELDDAENVSGVGKNVQVVTPHQMAAGYVPPTITVDSTGLVFGNGSVSPDILAEGSLKVNHRYSVKFRVDTLYEVPDYDHGYLYTNNGLYVHDLDLDNALVYQETPDAFSYDNLVFDDSLDYWYFKTGSAVTTDIFDGLRLMARNIPKNASFNRAGSGWVVGDKAIRVTPTVNESKYFPWDYDIVFTGQDGAYTGLVSSKTMRDENGNRIDRTKLLVQQSFSFYVQNKSFVDSTGQYELMDMVVQDMNSNGAFDILADRILVGPVTSEGFWAGTIFIIDFFSIPSTDNLPQANDVYRITFQKPFTASDSLTFTVLPSGALDTADLKENMDNIKVVPNPYVGTNAMEPSVANQYLNQRRQLMFTHVPAQCTIKIFTASGILVDELVVNNAASDGTAHWDMTTREGLEIAAGVYIYHVKATATGDEKIGKFAVIK